MGNIVKIKPSRNSARIILELNDKTVKMLEFKIANGIGEEVNWINGGNRTKIFNRTKYLQTNKYNYNSGEFYKYASVMANMDQLLNESDDKLKSFRKIIEICEGYNCISSNNIKVSVDDTEVMNLKEFVRKYL